MVYINISSNASYSNAFLMGRFRVHNHDIISEVQQFPEIHDPEKSGINLKINSRNVDPTKCTAIFNDTVLNILFRCNGKSASPCLLKITDAQKNTTLEIGTSLISSCLLMDRRWNLTFSYRFCHSPKVEHNFSCIFETSIESLREASEKDNYASCIVYMQITALVAFILGILCTRYYITIYYYAGIYDFIQCLKPSISKKTETSEECYRQIFQTFNFEHWIPTVIDENLSAGDNDPLNQQLLPGECPKKARHDEFISLDKFYIESIPWKYRHSLLEKLIQCVSNVTVILEVDEVNQSRPKLWLDTNVSYPLASPATSNHRSGSRTIWAVTMYTNGMDTSESRHKEYRTCPCTKCKTSTNPSSVWAKIKLSTSAALVNGDKEASSVKCKVCCGDFEPSDPLSDFSIDRHNNKTDMCSLTCYTCRIDLIDKFKKSLEELSETILELNSKQSLIRKKLKGMVFIVSYPHGKEKMLSWGNLTRIDNIREFGTRLFYTAHTCPGSSGASVIAPEFFDHWTYDNQFVHCGQVDSKLNCSGIARITKM